MKAKNLLADKDYASAKNREYLKSIGIKTESSNLHFGLGEEDISFAQEFFKNNFWNNCFNFFIKIYSFFS